MRSPLLLAIACLSVATTLQASSPEQATAELRCPITDERTFTDEDHAVSLFLSFFADGYYLRHHHRWPQNRASLQAQAGLTHGPQEINDIFAPIRRLDLQPQGRNLCLDVVYRISGRLRRQKIVLPPSKSQHAIFRVASEPSVA